ncbi:50S ribosomal protein L25 [Lysobacter concretionis Ko07 = DSM 16239]|jgi:large subunit ribosomal protein L25|uniref:Large ribosomal subunit protein bL25 n=1 Tax=Lysobacter concretionis Ko07 = DSM 16239 TaxID=1122185 RepID=A0A0A0EKV9_9GAMM|nr:MULTISPECIES: 50S ribosomal protein L25/general stress protein Ctc [Lysobacter]KGM50778.1 50S ribosomal protein L25 [Lysobacter concretionis Ko07 = DSM 16239]QOD91578.1 50S ribosomal protein L25/general stress protein Ctc [Lysobacter sp. CW239]
MSNKVIKATGRSVEGKGASRRLRHAGKIPAIVYGGTAAPQPVLLDQEKIWVASQNEWFYSTILDLDVDGKVESVLLRDMQRHPYKQIIMHLDFMRVNQKEVLRASVPLHFINEDISPAGKNADVIIMKELVQVEVSCLPKDLPENLQVDLSELELGDIIHLSKIQLPEGVEIPSLALGAEHDVAVVVARKGRVEAEPEVADEEATDAEVPATKAEKDAE